MKILVIGAGVIGTIYGYILAQTGNEVTHYLRAGKSKLFENGIRMRLLDGRGKKTKEYEAVYSLKMTEELSADHDYDLILVSVRHYQLESVLPLLRDFAGKADVLFFNGNWDGMEIINTYLLPSQYLWGFPVAGGGYTKEKLLNAALLDEIRLGELDGEISPRLLRLKKVFEKAHLKVDVQTNIKHWLWVHFAINSGVIGAAFKAGGASQLLSSIPRLCDAILASREALEICKRRGVNVQAFEDAKAFYQSPLLGAIAIWLMMKVNKPARKIMETHSAVDELQILYRDVLNTGEMLKMPMPNFRSLLKYVENPPFQEC
ncbi:MAG: ketopantoate reductase family protein [Leptolinea sp.]|jgi:2-dehydropantoate 2-reductase|nr:ketopantoate reductase family protein [Leptolinea sp.]